MNKETATALATEYQIPLGCDFHSLSSAEVERILTAARYWGYRKPRNANGSRARCFYAYLCRAASGPKWGTEHAIQGNYGHGWEDECCEETRREAHERLREYRENGPGAYRLITRRVKLRD